MKLIGSTPDGTPNGAKLKTQRAHDRHLKHYSVHVLAVAPEADDLSARRVLVRKRQLTEPRYPGLLTTTIGSHLMTQSSPMDVIRAAADQNKMRLGPLSYLGTFEIVDNYENEVCTLWTAEVTPAPELGRYIAVEPHAVAPRLATPHLVASLKIWNERR